MTFAWVSQFLKCESARRFQPGESLSRHLLREFEIFGNLRLQLRVLAVVWSGVKIKVAVQAGAGCGAVMGNIVSLYPSSYRLPAHRAQPALFV